MSNPTIRMDPLEKDKLSGDPEDRAAAWFREHEAALCAEAGHIETRGVPGSHLALNRPRPDERV